MAFNFPFFKARDNLGRSAADTPAKFSSFSFWSMARAPVPYQETIAAKDALKHVIAARCINKIAMSVASVDWYVQKSNSDPSTNNLGKREYVKAAEKGVAAVIANPNDNMTAWGLKYWLAMNLACYGLAMFKVGLSGSKQPNGIYPLPVDMMKFRFSRYSTVEGYETNKVSNFGSMNLDIRSKAESASKLEWGSHILYPSLEGYEVFDSRNAPLNTIGLSAQLINELLHRAIDTATGSINSNLIVSTESPIPTPEHEAIKAKFDKTSQGGEDAGKAIFINGAKVTVQRIDQDLKDIHSKMPLDDSARMIAGAFGIPIALIGIGAADGAKFASNYAESRQAFWEDTITPYYLRVIEEGMTAALCDTGYEVKFDLDTIDAVVESRAKRAAILEPVSFLTRDEKRVMCGYAPDGKPDTPPAPKKTS